MGKILYDYDLLTYAYVSMNYLNQGFVPFYKFIPVAILLIAVDINTPNGLCRLH